MDRVRPPILAGSWYPADPARLRERVAAYLAGADRRHCPAARPRVAVVPHAGYAFSGPTAGQFFGLLGDLEFDAVFILAPSHHARLRRAVLSGLDAFATPLGTVPLARDIVAALAATPCFEIDDRAHAQEHAVEIQLPFLQCALRIVPPIVPILVPHLDRQERRQTSAALAPWRDERHLFLVSSDFTHYGADYGYVPFCDRIPERIETLDTGAMLKILSHDADGLAEYGAATGITMCGLDAAALALAGEPPLGYEAALLGYARSGDQTQDYGTSVSYASLVLCAEAVADHLSVRERDRLLDLARAAVTAAVLGAPPPAVAGPGEELPVRLARKRGAFVTLTARDGELRGCIGVIEPRQRLVDAVVANARSAALEDPRFTPVQPWELAHLHVEVSALTPLRRVAGPDEIEIGRHGIMMVKGGRRAVFLPQVATEQGWDLETTLDHLARKAGLATGAWRNETELHIFEAEILAEEPV